MTRVSIDINDEWLTAARRELGTRTKVATVNEALRLIADRARAREAIEVLDSIEIDLTGDAPPWRVGGGDELDGLAERAGHEFAEPHEAAG